MKLRFMFTGAAANLCNNGAQRSHEVLPEVELHAAGIEVEEEDWKIWLLSALISCWLRS